MREVCNCISSLYTFFRISAVLEFVLQLLLHFYSFIFAVSPFMVLGRGAGRGVVVFQVRSGARRQRPLAAARVRRVGVCPCGAAASPLGGK